MQCSLDIARTVECRTDCYPHLYKEFSGNTYINIFQVKFLPKDPKIKSRTMGALGIKHRPEAGWGVPESPQGAD